MLFRSKQAKNVIIDLRRCKMREDVAMAKLISIFTNRRKRDGRLLVIRKNGKVIEIKDPS